MQFALYENVIVDPRIIYVCAKRSSLDGAIFPLSLSLSFWGGCCIPRFAGVRI